MRTQLRLLITILVLVLPISGYPQTDSAPPRLSRGDWGGTLGWFLAETPDLTGDGEQDWYGRSLHASAGAGWYWTDSLKTEIDFSATTNAKIRTYARRAIDGRFVNTPVENSFSTRKIAIGQHYQWRRNAWVTPYVAAGIETTWERSREQHGPTYVYDASRPPQLIAPPHTVGPRTDVVVRPFASAGFKGYMTPRSFFRSDLRVGLGNGIEEIVIRVGFGRDF